MTIQLASAIVSQLGPCRIALDVPAMPTLPTELALLGCDVGSQAATAVVIQSDTQAPADRLARYASADALVVIAGEPTSSATEAALFAAGWRRHPGAVNLAALTQLDQGRLPDIGFYQRAAPDYAGILNDPGHAAIAAVARWTTAAERVRAGDRVLVCGPDAHDGQTIVEALSRAGSVEVLEEGSDKYEARSFDLVIAYDAPGACRANVEFCGELLKLDGRLVFGWSNDGDAGPQDWQTLEDMLSADFLVEGRGVQYPGSVAPQPAPLDHADPLGWQIVVAAINPIGGEAERDTYVHPAFGRSDATVVDFANGYDNPWLYRTMVQMGERLTDDTKLARLAEYVAVNARPGSADQGAALAVLGYRILESRSANVVPMLLSAIGTYCDAGGDAPHVIRWRVSLAFLAGRASELMEDRPAAKQWYERAAADDWQRFSHILATKTIGAAFFLGRILLAEGDAPAAWTWFARGVEVARQAAGADHSAEIGNPDTLLPFYLPELAEVIDMGSQCANALANRHLWQRNPGLFWRQVDVKRFGLASWAIDVARENAQLRQMMGRAG